MLRRPIRLHALAAALVCAFVAGPSRAQPASEIAAAKAWFAEGIGLENDGKWRDALDRFKRAQAVKHTPAIDFHVGLCEARSGDLVAAMVDLERAAASGREKHDDKVTAAATSELADVKSRAPTLQIDAPPDRVRRIAVDGAPFATAMLGAPLPMNPGDHVVAIDFTSGHAEQKVTLAERETKKLSLDPPPSPSPPTPTLTPTPTQPPSPPPPRSQTLPLVLLASSGALVAGSAVFFLLRQNEISTIDATCPSRVHCDPALESNADTGKTYTTLSFALGGVGLAAAAVGAGLLVFGAPHETQVALVPTPNGASLAGRF